MKEYNRRKWLNSKASSSTSSIICFDGNVDYADKTYRDTFLKIYDCKGSITIHKKDSESNEQFIQKLELITTEIQKFITYIKNEKR